MLEINSPLRKTKKKLILIQKIALFLSKTQGRDKLCKVLQYVFRFLAACFEIDSYKNIKYASLSGTIFINQFQESTKDARKIFRLFKSVNQYEGMAFILFNEEQNITNLLKLLGRFCYFFYWAFDNISILSKIKLFKLDYQKLYKLGSGFWFCALAFMNTSFLIQLIFSNQIAKLPMDLKQQHPSQIPQNCPLLPDFEMKKRVLSVELSEDQKKRIRKQKWLNLIKNSFDLMPSGKQSKILEVIFNRIIPQKVVGLCGFASAAISIYQIILDINTNN